MSKESHYTNVSIKELPSPINVLVRSQKEKSKFDWKFFAGFILSIVTFALTNYFTARSGIASKHRDVIIENMLSAYNSLASALEYGVYDSRSTPFLQDAFSKIQIFGSHEEIQELNRIIQLMNNNQSANTDDLINMLRNDIREQIDLEAEEGTIKRVGWRSDTSLNKK